EYFLLDDPKFTHILRDIKLDYHQNMLKTKIVYTPLGAYRPQTILVQDIDNARVCKDFNALQAEIIFGLKVLEKNLCLKNQEHAILYKKFIVKSLSDINNNG